MKKHTIIGTLVTVTAIAALVGCASGPYPYRYYSNAYYSNGYYYYPNGFYPRAPVVDYRYYPNVYYAGRYYPYGWYIHNIEPPYRYRNPDRYYEYYYNYNSTNTHYY